MVVDVAYASLQIDETKWCTCVLASEWYCTIQNDWYKTVLRYANFILNRVCIGWAVGIVIVQPACIAYAQSR